MEKEGDHWQKGAGIGANNQGFKESKEIETGAERPKKRDNHYPSAALRWGGDNAGK